MMDREFFKKTARYCIAASDCRNCQFIDEPSCVNMMLSEAIIIIESLERELNEAKNKADDIILPSGADKAIKKAILESFEKYYKAESYTDVWDFERAMKRFKVLEDLNDRI